MKMLQRKLSQISIRDNLPLFLILIVGSALRFWNYSEMPFMHDELSALSRLQFKNIYEVIEFGVKQGDTHPAGVQLFLYLWTNTGGTSEEWVKLPFIICGIISIWLVYRIGTMLFDRTVGLLSATMVASTQFFIMYSQIARPYSSGLFLTLLMVYFWSKYFLGNGKLINLLWFILVATAAAYNHHFSLLFAAVVGISGLLFIKTFRDLIVYAIAGLFIFMLYSPHLGIFFHQLSIGGIGGWLSEPELSFPFDYINYSLHFSYWVWGTLFVVVGISVFKKGEFARYKDGIGKRLLLLSWFLLPLLIGYVYSIIVNPVIQYSMLIFSTPYIYMVVFSFHKSIKPVLTSIFIVMILFINSATLIAERNHFKIFYHQPYEELFETALFESKIDDVIILNDCVPYFSNFYFNKFGKQVPYFTKRNKELSIDQFRNLVSEIDQDYVVCHALTGEEFKIVEEFFPYVLDVKQGFTYDIYKLGKQNYGDAIALSKILSFTDFIVGANNWTNTKSSYNSDTDSHICMISETDEWGPATTLDVEEIAPEGRGIIDITANIKTISESETEKVLIVLNILDGNESIYWNAINIFDYKYTSGKFNNYYLSVDLQTALKGRSDVDGLKFKINIWNKSRTRFDINFINISIRPGNQYRYGLYNKI